MRKLIFKSIFFTVLFILVFSVTVILVIGHRYNTDNQKNYLSQNAVFVAEGVRQKGIGYLQSIKDADFRITWITGEGTVLYDNKTDISQGENHKNREEVTEALSKGTGYSKRFSDTLSKPFVYYAIKLEDNTVIRVSEEAYAFGINPDYLSAVVWVTVIALALSLLLAVIVSKKAVLPVTGLDLSKPEISKTYEEMKPVVSRLVADNRLISKQAEELRVKQIEFDAITTNMSDGIIIISRRADILSCNQAAMNMLGVIELPKNVLQLNKSDNFRETIRTSLSGKKCFDTIRTDENYYTLHATPLLFDDNVEGAVIVIIDETEKDEREKLRREFTTNVSHELKTPLTSISGFAELIKSGITTEKDTAHFADNIYREARRLVTLVNDIIRLSQLDEGEIPYDEGEIDLYEIAKDVADRLDGVAKTQKISLNLTGETAFVKGNSQILEEMIYNLCDNGIKYNRPGGYVNINVSSDTAFVYASVKDNGIGIPKASQGRVFERFYRVDKSHSKEIGGTGLGLSIVKHGAAYHKARISLESSPGNGTEITLVFPKAMADSPDLT